MSTYSINKIKDKDGNIYNLIDSTAVHTIDSAFSDTSTNPVQNALVTKYK
jgi:hypothetical protein